MRHLQISTSEAGHQVEMFYMDEYRRHIVPVETPLNTFKEAVEFGAVVAQNYEIELLTYGFRISSPESADIARAVKCHAMYGNDSADYDWPNDDEKVWPMSHYTGYVQ
jgi:hypothetical protein